MGAGHFVFIPAVLVIGMVIGWMLGSRAAHDAYAAELRRRDERADRQKKAAESGRRNPGSGRIRDGVQLLIAATGQMRGVS